MSDVKELKDEDLEKVSGGAKFYLYEVSVGDVFLLSNDSALIVKSNVTDKGNDPDVPVVLANLIDNTWKRNKDVNTPMSFLNNYTYSQALTGTLNHLL